MKKILSLILVCSLVKVSAQLPIAEASSYSEGIYLTYEEFVNNAPSMNLSYEIKEKKGGYGLFGLEGNIPVYFMKIKRKEAREIGAIFGFSDGKQVYINPWMEDLKSSVRFYPVEFIRGFCYMEYLFTTRINNSSLNDKKTMVIDLKSQKAIGLDKNSMREILAKYPNLLEAFENESRKNTKLKEYFIKYLEQVEVSAP